MKILENSVCGFTAPVFNLNEAFVLFKFLFNAAALVVELFEKIGRELMVVGPVGGEDFDGAVGELNANEAGMSEVLHGHRVVGSDCERYDLSGTQRRARAR